MKKNRMMRAASALLVAVLLTTCTISGTFAKYTTTVEGTATARVAAWGFGDSTTIIYELFSNSYEGGDVSASEKVFAPGTAQTASVVLDYEDTTGKGAPEVKYQVTLKFNETASDCPDAIKDNANITWSFGSYTGLTWTQLIEKVNSYTENVDAGHLPTLTTATVGWNWAFSGSDGDAKDTALGNTIPSVTVAIDFIATQLGDDD